MKLESLLGDFPLRRFVAEHYQRLPYSAAGNACALCELGTWEMLTNLLARDVADVLVCRRNEQHSGDAPRSVDEAEQLIAEGYTLLVRHAEKHDERLREVAAAFARDFAAPVNIHMYCTPGGQYGFGWHYDAEEVFIVQTTGRKQYSLRKNTVNPWPIEREIMPLMRCELAAGDWLYIPSGYWHMGESRETAISLAIGVQPRTAVEVFDFLRSQIVDSIRWRQRLPVAGAAATDGEDELREQYAAVFNELGQELSKRLSDSRLVAAFLAQIRASQPGPQSAAAEARAGRKA
jgi:ribosomal protein L16 Arg81 hydroxylase